MWVYRKSILKCSRWFILQHEIRCDIDHGNGDLKVRRLSGRYKSAAPLGYSGKFKGMGLLDLPGGDKGCIAIWSNGHGYV
jgi:hypothetical protein